MSRQQQHYDTVIVHTPLLWKTFVLYIHIHLKNKSKLGKFEKQVAAWSYEVGLILSEWHRVGCLRLEDFIIKEEWHTEVRKNSFTISKMTKSEFVLSDEFIVTITNMFGQ